REGRRWFVGFQAEVLPSEPRAKGQVIGVDWGTSVLAALSTGEALPNPRFAETAAKALARGQRRVARRKKGSRRRLKAREQLQRLHRKVANRRRNHLDKVSKRLVTHFRAVCVEHIEAKALMNAERVGESTPQFVKTRRNREVLDTAPHL